RFDPRSRQADCLLVPPLSPIPPFSTPGAPRLPVVLPPLRFSLLITHTHTHVYTRIYTHVYTHFHHFQVLRNPTCL
uniref:Uncharacterized protein n=1 Tax=Denticeps clupeoides TaxID=299321 RepID=A0AAY4C823_9TELE